jgi:hypothetical protein
MQCVAVCSSVTRVSGNTDDGIEFGHYILDLSDKINHATEGEANSDISRLKVYRNYENIPIWWLGMKHL